MDKVAPLSGLDNIWHLMGSISEFDPLILSVFTCADTVPVEELRAALTETANAFPRFKQRLARHNDPAQAPFFEEDSEFDIRNHVRAVQLPANQRDSRGLDRYVSDLISRLWDHSRSPWDVVVCNDYRDGTGAKCAIVFRAHHVIADGQGFVRAVLWATTFRPEIEKLIQGPPRPKPQLSLQLSATGISDSLKRSAWTIFDAFAFLALAALTWWRIVNLTPSNREQNLARRLDTPRPSPARTFTRHPRRRRFARSAAIKLSDIRKVQKAFTGRGDAFKDGREKLTTRVAGEHVTLNDVMVAVLAECMHKAKDAVRADASRSLPGRALDGVLPDRVACFIPMSFRRPHDATAKNRSLGGMVYIPRPPSLGVSGRSKRDIYEAIHRAKFQLSLIKRSRTPRRLADWIVDPLASLPLLFPWPMANLPTFFRRSITTPIMNIALSSLHCVLTNVPGCSERVKLHDRHTILQWTVAPPQGAVGTLGIGILSYAGELSISVVADAVEGDEADGGVARRVCDDFAETFALYLRAAEELLRDA